MPAIAKLNGEKTTRGEHTSRVRRLALSLTMKLLKVEVSSIGVESLSEELGVSQETLLEVVSNLEDGDIIRRTEDGSSLIVPSGEERLKLAIAAVALGAKIEESAGALSWKEFEAFCTKVFEANGYSCMHEFRFKSTSGQRYECDVVATSRPIILLVDCKHYGGRVTGLRTVVKKQLERVGAASRSISLMIRKIPQIVRWEEAFMLPLIVTLLPENIAMVDSVPVVPAFKLNQFLQELPSNIESTTNIRIKPSKQRTLV